MISPHVCPSRHCKQYVYCDREHLAMRITIASQNLVLAKYSGMTTLPELQKKIVYRASTGLRLLLALLAMTGPKSYGQFKHLCAYNMPEK